MSVVPIVCSESLGCDSVRPGVTREPHAKKPPFAAGRRKTGGALVLSSAEGSVVFALRFIHPP